MRYLLDTHAFIWIVTGETEYFSKTLMNIIENTENALFLSAASIWEMMIKCSINRLSIPKPEKSFLTEQMAISNITELPVNMEHSFEIINLPLFHKDPFDRILVSQARVENMRIITRDKKMSLYDIDIVW
jgi:PIN domain nuclease of toxin-antitoxin system